MEAGNVAVLPQVKKCLAPQNLVGPTSGHCGLMTRWPLEAHCVCLRKCFTEILPFSPSRNLVPSCLSLTSCLASSMVVPMYLSSVLLQLPFTEVLFALFTFWAGY